MVRTDGRAYGHVITKFSRMGRLPHFLSYGAPSTRALRAGGAPLKSLKSLKSLQIERKRSKEHLHALYIH